MRKQQTRRQLYELVWSEPVSKLAKRFGLSDVALAKHCRRLNVPRPPRGYWAKLAAGKRVVQAELPPRGPGMNDEFEIGRSRYWWRRSYKDEDILAMIPEPPRFDRAVAETAKQLTSKVGRIGVPRKLLRPHIHIQRLLDADEERRDRQSRSRFAPSWDAPLFDAAIEQRRLRVLNALFVALTRIGAKTSIQGKDGVAAQVKINDTTVSFELAVVSATRSTTRSTDRTSKTGQCLRLKIEGNSEEGRRSEWCESELGRLESHIADIVRELIIAAERNYRRGEIAHYEWLLQRKTRIIEERQRREEEARRRAEVERQRREQARIDRLLGEAAALRQAMDIRRYVGEVRELSERGEVSVEAAIVQEWSRWALDQADSIDPVRSRRFLESMSEQPVPNNAFGGNFVK